MFLLNVIIFFICATSCNTSQDCPTIVSEFSQLNCTSQSTVSASFYYHFDEDTCLPGCNEYTSSSPSCSEDTKECPPAYSCEQRCNGIISNRQHKCTVDADCTSLGRSFCRWFCMANDDSCMAYHATTDDYLDTYWTALKFKPDCDNDGNWAAKQCKGGLGGRCMCFDAHGNRIFGQALRSKAIDMSCACSRKRAELVAAGRSYVSFHCDEYGNYEKLQCDNGQCWCVEPKTGELTASVVPEKAMVKLPCYSASEVGSQYLRQCESKKYAIQKLTDKLQTHGVQWASFDFLLCDDDGSYGAYSVSSGIAYCTWRDNSKIGTWQANTLSDFESLDCKCARDYKKYSHNQECEGNGNYKTLQQVISSAGTYYYCVDSDGFAKSNLVTDKDTNCTQYY